MDELTRPFWEAARHGRLAIQRCQTCAFYNHPPKPLCDRCQSSELHFEVVSGLGRIWSYSVMHQKSVAGFEKNVPYATALVELDEQPMLLLLTNLLGVAPTSITIGDRVQVDFEWLSDEICLPQFVPAVTK
jgi:uncharacterized OB-fold protein